MVNYLDTEQASDVDTRDLDADEAMDRIFAALSNRTRRALLARLAQGESTVGELAEHFPMSPPAITKHLNQLERAGLIERRQDGRLRHCRLQAEPLAQAAEWLARYRVFWEERFDALDAYLRDAHAPSDPSQGEST